MTLRRSCVQRLWPGCCGPTRRQQSDPPGRASMRGECAAPSGVGEDLRRLHALGGGPGPPRPRRARARGAGGRGRGRAPRDRRRRGPRAPQPAVPRAARAAARTVASLCAAGAGLLSRNMLNMLDAHPVSLAQPHLAHGHTVIIAVPFSLSLRSFGIFSPHSPVGGGAAGANDSSGRACVCCTLLFMHLTLHLGVECECRREAPHPQTRQGTERWEASRQPFTAHAAPPAGAPASASACGGALQDAVETLARARRGLLVLGELPGAADAAAALRVGAALGWPVAADVLSGARVGAVHPSPDPTGPSVVLHHFDHLLLDAAPGAAAAGGGMRHDAAQALRAALRPDAVLQLGGRLTSKRLQAFLEGSAVPDAESGRCGHGRRWFVVAFGWFVKCPLTLVRVYGIGLGPASAGCRAGTWRRHLLGAGMHLLTAFHMCVRKLVKPVTVRALCAAGRQCRGSLAGRAASGTTRRTCCRTCSSCRCRRSRPCLSARCRRRARGGRCGRRARRLRPAAAAARRRGRRRDRCGAGRPGARHGRAVRGAGAVARAAGRRRAVPGQQHAHPRHGHVRHSAAARARAAGPRVSTPGRPGGRRRAQRPPGRPDRGLTIARPSKPGRRR
jgi:hypothetical protein